MTRRQKILLTIAILFALAAVVFLLLGRQQGGEVVNAPGANATVINTSIGGTVTAGGTNSASAGVNQPNANQPTVNQPAPRKADVKPDERSNAIRVAMAFSERFGSFSNSSSFSNILDLKPAMTETMAAWADKYVEDLQASTAPSGEYYGTTTRAVNSQLINFDEVRGFATVKVTTQRHESTAVNPAGRTYYQDITLDLRRQDGVWKVDAAYWAKL